METKRFSVAAVIVVVVGFLGAGAVPAAYASAEVAPDVVAAFSDTAIDDVRDQVDTLPALEDAASFGPVHRVYRWSDALVAGDAGDPVTALDEWVAPVLSSSGEALAIYRVWRESPDSVAEFAGVDGDAATAAAIVDVDADAALVSDPTVAAWYAVWDDVATPVGSATFSDIRAGTPVGEVATLVSERTAQAVRDAAPPAGRSFAGWVWGGVGVLAIAAIGVCVGARRRVPVG
ncbi:hypothetical protein [Microbacterium sp. LMI1x-1-1.1]|uniref:hypothetical protein n=1 Tax=Microbacterium sp. LMI1x-1-1.1 TaxID=3135246 RepID=UPI00342BC1C2